MGQDDEHDHDKAGDAAFDKILRSYSEKNSSRVCTLLMTKGARLDELNAKDLTPCTRPWQMGVTRPLNSSANMLPRRAQN